MCGAVLLLPSAAIAAIAPAFQFCPAGHALSSLGAPGGLICDYSAGRVVFEVCSRSQSPGNIGKPRLEFDGCPSRSKTSTAAHPRRSRIPTSSQNRRVSNNPNVLLIRQREGVPAHGRTGSKRIEGMARQSVTPSWAGWQVKRLSSSCIRRLCTRRISIWIRSRSWVVP